MSCNCVLLLENTRNVTVVARGCIVKKNKELEKKK